MTSEKKPSILDKMLEVNYRGTNKAQDQKEEELEDED
jgi:hypothetical protein